MSIMTSASELDQATVHEISIGNQNANSMAVVEKIFGVIPSGYNKLCTSNQKNYAVFTIENDAHHNFITVTSIEITKTKPPQNCVLTKKPISFAGITPGMYQPEIEGIFNSKGYKKAVITPKYVTYEKRSIETATCHHYPESEYDQEYYAYGSNEHIVSFTLSDLKSGMFNSVTKRLGYNFVPSNNDQCQTRNKSLQRSTGVPVE